MYNYNTNNNPEYDLYTDLIDETINLYGVPVKFLVTIKLNSDDTVFGDYSSIKTDNSKVFEIYAMPENPESWDSAGYNFSEFGMLNLDNVSVFISKNTVETIMQLDFKALYNNLVVMPNNKIMEVTDVQFEVPGINNLFTFKNAKSVYKLTLKPYAVKMTDEIDTKDISIEDGEDYNTLNNYFEELLGRKESLKEDMEINPSIDTIIKHNDVDEVKIKPRIDKTVDSVFGEFN